MAGKGSKRRPGDENAYRDNWEHIFRRDIIPCDMEPLNDMGIDELYDCDTCDWYNGSCTNLAICFGGDEYKRVDLNIDKSQKPT